MIPKNFQYQAGQDLLLSFHSLPALLNHYEVSVEQFTNLRFADKPGLVYHVLHAMLEAGVFSVGRRLIKATQKRLHRRYKTAMKEMSLPGNVSVALLDLLEGHDRRPHVERREEMSGYVKQLAERVGLYQQDGKVQARLAGTFGYDPYDVWKRQTDDFFELECDGCGHSEIVMKPLDWIELGDLEAVRAEVPEVLAEMDGTEFTHVSGPYIRCPCCKGVHRALLSEAHQLPAGTEVPPEDYDEEWAGHVGTLEGLVDRLVDHGKEHSLPKPFRLVITANHIRWDGATGYTECRVDGAELADKLRVDSEFNISNGQLLLEPDGTGRLTCSLAHHDATGFMEVEPQWLSELADDDRDEGAIITCADFPQASTYLPRIAEILLCGSNSYFEFSSGSTFKLVGKDDLIGHLEWLGRQLGWEAEDTQGKDVWSSVIAGNLLITNFIYDLRMAATECDGNRLIGIARHLRHIIGVYIVELENFNLE